MRGKFLFEKVLTASDTSPLGRIILPKVSRLVPYLGMVLFTMLTMFWFIVFRSGLLMGGPPASGVNPMKGGGSVCRL